MSGKHVADTPDTSLAQILADMAADVADINRTPDRLLEEGRAS